MIKFNPFHFTNSSYRLQVVTYVAPYNPICPSLFQVSLLHPLLHKPPVNSKFGQHWSNDVDEH
ncbi:hypothetical protein C0J52_19574 [Blattella germanica]|nr:hypothetical protein C0J52_19574 [Blattella germanica]